MSESNAALTRQFQQNDQSAFSQLFGRHHRLVFNVCMRLLGNRQDAEDATQETFSRFAKHIDRWDSRRPLEPWLVTIAGNRCRTQLARKTKMRSSELVAEPVSIADAQQQAADLLAEEVRLALTILPPTQREAFELFYDSALDYAEIARRMQCPVGTAKTWVRRARMSLMQSLRERSVVHGPLSEKAS